MSILLSGLILEQVGKTYPPAAKRQPDPTLSGDKTVKPVKLVTTFLCLESHLVFLEIPWYIENV